MSQTPSKKAIRIFLALILFAGIAVYANSFNGAFVWDDGNLIVNNLHIRSAEQLPNVFVHSIRSGAGETEGTFYRPIQMLTYFFDFSIWNLNVYGYHLTNTLLHILCAFSVFWLIYTLFTDTLLAFVTSLLFVVHPIHTEAVAYISGRADSLVSIFMILTFILYVKGLHTKNFRNTMLIILCYIGALLSKEYALVLPSLLMVYHATFQKPVQMKRLVALGVTTLVYLVVRLLLVETQSPPEYPSPPLGARIPGIFVALTHYFRLLPFPFQLHMEYGGILFEWTYPRTLIGLIATCALLVFAFKQRLTHRWAFFAFLWFFIAMIPYYNFFTLNAYMAEHWLYLSSIGFFLIVAKGLCALYRSVSFKKLGIVLAIALVVFYGTLTVRQNRVWTDPATLYEWTLQFAPESSRLNSNLGIIYHKRGRYDEAIELFKKAVALDPVNANAYGNLGNAYRSAGRHEEAIALHKKVIAFKPQGASGYNNLGTVYYDIGELDKALQQFRKVLELNPNHDMALNNMGLVFGKMGKKAEAVAMFKKAIEINPNYAEPHYTLAIIYYNGGEYEQATKHCDKALKLGYPVHPELVNALKPFRK